MRRTVALLLVAAVTLAGCNLPEGTVGANDWDLQAIGHDGRTLLVSTFFGGLASDCTRLERWEIGESDDEVEIRAMLWRRRAPSGCTDDGATEELTIRLDAPLGDRRITGCGRDDCREVGSETSFAYVEVDAGADAVAVVSRSELVVLDPVPGEVTHRHEGYLGRASVTDGTVVAETDEGRTAAYAVSPRAGSGLPSEPAEPRWAIRTRPLAVVGDRLITCDGDAPAQQVSSRDVATGERGWSSEVLCPERPVTDGDLLAGTARDDTSAPHLVVIDLDDGAVVTDVVHRIGDGGVALVGDRLVTLGRGGSTVWDLAGERLETGNATGDLMLGTADGLAIGASLEVPWLVAVEPETAHLAWRRRLDGPAGQYASVAGDAVFVAEQHGRELHRLDLDTGDPVWTADAGASLAVDVAVHGDTAYVATVTSVLALALDTGEVRWATTHLEADTPTEASEPS